MRKFIIHPIARSGRADLAKQVASVRAMLVLTEGRGVVVLRGNEGLNFEDLRPSILRSISPMLNTCCTAERRLLWMYKGRNSGWKIKLHQRKWPGLLGDRNKLLQMGSRYLRTDLLQDEDVQGFLGQQTTRIGSIDSPAAHNQRSIDLRRLAAVTSRMRSRMGVEC
ncbi:hypothetical protein ACRCRN_29000 [Pseudomonas aeruginosa]